MEADTVAVLDASEKEAVGTPVLGIIQQDGETARLLERQYAKGNLPGAFLAASPLSGAQTTEYLRRLYGQRSALSPGAAARVGYALGLEGPGTVLPQRVWNEFYRNGRDFLYVSGDDFALAAQPLAYLSLGTGRQSEFEGREASRTVWRNTRGARIAGRVGSVFFESRLEENQEKVIRPAREDGTAPRLGLVSQPDGSDVYDYFVATGGVGWRGKHFEVRLVRDRNQWGYGANSLILSDYATVYDQLQIRTQVWRLHYTNLFTRFTDPEEGDTLWPSKYGAYHRLAIDLPWRLQLELFEAVAFSDGPDDDRDGFELGYLNPLIFYRAVERELGSPDNVMLGAGASWIAYPGVQLYGQAILDELTVSEFFNNWWGNKWGYVIGAYLVDIGVNGVDVRAEYSRLRPYLYSHTEKSEAFVHQNDVLGHPARANAEDFLIEVGVRPTPRTEGAVRLAYTRRGRDADSLNYGSDPTLPNTTRVSNRGVETLQGVLEQVLLVEARASYRLLPDLYLDLALRAESVDDEVRGLDRYVVPFVSVRWGLAPTSVRY